MPRKRRKPRGNLKKQEILPISGWDPRICELEGIGPKTAARLHLAGYSDPYSLLGHFPRTYEDRRTTLPLSKLEDRTRAVTIGTVREVKTRGPKWKSFLEVVFEDGDSELKAIWFAKQRPNAERFELGKRFVLAGPISLRGEMLQMAHPIACPEGEEHPFLGRIVPIYPDIPGVPRATVYKAIRSAAANVNNWVVDPLPDSILKHLSLESLAESFKNIHLPSHDISQEDINVLAGGDNPCQRRLAFDELFFSQLSLLRRRANFSKESALRLGPFPYPLIEAPATILGFRPTSAQIKVCEEIQNNLSLTIPMQRLLQGDVGSGKTLVALSAMLAACRSGYQAAFMAPTEILAIQHGRTMAPILDRLAISHVVHTAKVSGTDQQKNLASIISGEAQIVIGTHSLIQKDVVFPSLALAVIDEQHRFGVAQRLDLVNKGANGTVPHLLVMTATPIPRSLALAVHGDLDLCVIDEKPPGRSEVETHLLKAGKRAPAWKVVGEAIAKGEQIYVVCPSISESNSVDMGSIEQMQTEVSKRFGKDNFALLHGSMDANQRSRSMDAFVTRKVSILIATSIIEVGVDVPNATVMIIESAERFGLAQLHQLRGRIGRSNKRSFCYMLTGTTKVETIERLQTIQKTQDGFQIAKEDLKLRGHGELFGMKQSGLTRCTGYNLDSDEKLLELARLEAQKLLMEDPSLKRKKHGAILAELERRRFAVAIGEEAG